jgi:hypothetical protein
MTRRLTIDLNGGGRIAIRVHATEDAIPFDGFAELLGLPPPPVGPDPADPEPADVEIVTPDAMPENRRTLFSNSLTEAAFDPDWSRVFMAPWKKRPRDPHFYKCYVWHASLIYANMAAILRGENAVLVHCAVLETASGAVVIFGESGMGKSTASARWRAHGGRCIADDMALLDFSAPDGIVRVRRMPTWSACRENRNEWNYPVADELPLVALLALGRSESGRDEIVPISPAQFFAQCYRSIFYWNLFYAKPLPEQKKAALVDSIRSHTASITKRFAPRALLTVLEGDLVTFIKDNL